MLTCSSTTKHLVANREKRGWVPGETSSLISTVDVTVLGPSTACERISSEQPVASWIVLRVYLDCLLSCLGRGAV
jgi:hypothetical protein